jgi:hypothetical protein
MMINPVLVIICQDGVFPCCEVIRGAMRQDRVDGQD